MDCRNDLKETAQSLAKVKSICSFIAVTLKIVFPIVCLYWAFTVILIIGTLVNPDAFDFFGTSDLTSTLLYLLYDITIAAMFVTFIKIFSDASKGESPFTLLQVKRLRVLALLLLLCGIIDISATASASIMQYGNVDAGYYSTTDNIVIPINFAPFITAAVIFAFSFVFKYGVLLQEFTDETL
ncbi:hypothetical protein [Arabiibacter massiliensis]|uniref:hypothetical protein n=1 Tax=Arabiibacter massiliensis TaxID=1870985 RepID=UPI00117B2060|nr:hypothetical protein [Arabiibacter massiliensis]